MYMCIYVCMRTRMPARGSGRRLDYNEGSTGMAYMTRAWVPGTLLHNYCCTWLARAVCSAHLHTMHCRACSNAWTSDITVSTPLTPLTLGQRHDEGVELVAHERRKPFRVSPLRRHVDGSVGRGWVPHLASRRIVLWAVDVSTARAAHDDDLRRGRRTKTAEACTRGQTVASWIAGPLQHHTRAPVMERHSSLLSKPGCCICGLRTGCTVPEPLRHA